MNGLHGIQPNSSDARGFVHKRVIGGIGGAVGGFLKGGPAGVIGGAVGGFVGGGAPARTGCPPGFNPGPGGGCVPAVAKVPGLRGFAQRVIPGGATGFETTLPVLSPFQQRIAREQAARLARGEPAIVTPGGTLVIDPGAVPSPQIGTGQAVVGRFGAGMEPMVRQTSVRECARGAVLAVDGLCYNRRDLRNSERFWPRGRRPLLTGGEMRAISTAASAARKLQRKQKDLQDLPGHKASLSHT